MRFITFEEVAEHFRGKTVALVGSAPSALQNAIGFVDWHDVVVRVNNYKLGPAQGQRTDVHYSFYGRSIKKSAEELRRDGVTLCICKCPDDMPLRCDWHERTGKVYGTDFRYIYRFRKAFWFCDTYVPDVASFFEKFYLLDKHIPTTGFAAILDVLACQPKRLYLTGFDFFSSGVHNIDERWRPGDPTDPIGHRPDLEMKWLAANARRHPIAFDETLESLVGTRRELAEAAA
jgi:hypothetical protein